MSTLIISRLSRKSLQSILRNILKRLILDRYRHLLAYFFKKSHKPDYSLVQTFMAKIMKILEAVFEKKKNDSNSMGPNYAGPKDPI